VTGIIAKIVTIIAICVTCILSFMQLALYWPHRQMAASSQAPPCSRLQSMLLQHCQLVRLSTSAFLAAGILLARSINACVVSSSPVLLASVDVVFVASSARATVNVSDFGGRRFCDFCNAARRDRLSLLDTDQIIRSFIFSFLRAVHFLFCTPSGHSPSRLSCNGTHIHGCDKASLV